MHFTSQRLDGSSLPDYLQLKRSTIFSDVHYKASSSILGSLAPLSSDMRYVGLKRGRIEVRSCVLHKSLHLPYSLIFRQDGLGTLISFPTFFNSPVFKSLLKTTILLVT